MSPHFWPPAFAPLNISRVKFSILVPASLAIWFGLKVGLVVNEDELHTARETDTHSSATPNWTNAPGFEQDVFTFTRVIFKSDPGPRSNRGRLRWLGWWVDYPDADLNLSYRLQQLTSINTDPDGRVLKLTDPALFQYPLLYMEHAGYMRLSDEEVVTLRKYLLCGGALFVNDFWGSEEWNGFAGEINRVLPGRNWTELTTDHPVFQLCLRLCEDRCRSCRCRPSSFGTATSTRTIHNAPQQTIFRGEGSEEMHVRALLDDHRRIMILAIHNSDISDGWEREQENETYFNQYSERVAYPLGINIIFYLMTH